MTDFTTKPDAVIVDIDGTLALSSRDPDEAARRGINCRPWGGATPDQVYADTVNKWVVSLVSAVRYHLGAHVIYLTGRTEEYRDITSQWLERVARVPASKDNRLFMRPDSDTRTDAVVKREIYERDIAPRYNVVLAIDDLKPIVELWRSLGIPTIDVAGNNYEHAVCNPKDVTEPEGVPERPAIDVDNRTAVQKVIDIECSEISRMLQAKNAAYGNSALDPVRIFSKANPEEQINVRIDDKLSRLVRGTNAGEDVELDLIGYLILKRVFRAMRPQREAA